MTERSCLSCYELFAPRRATHRYCSRKCSPQSKRDLLDKLCAVCGKRFRPYSSTRKMIACSFECAGKWRGMRNTNTCLDRISDRISHNQSGCWIINGSRDVNGYGQITVDKKREKAHRVVFRLMVGTIPQGLELDHLCMNKSCVNPEHLEAVTHKENMRRCFENRAKTLGRKIPTTLREL